MNTRGMDTPQYKELREVIRQFRDEELEHYDIGQGYLTDKSVLHDAIKNSIQISCRAAIWLSTRY